MSLFSSFSRKVAISHNRKQERCLPVRPEPGKAGIAQRDYREDLLPLGVALLQDVADLIPSEEFLDSGRKCVLFSTSNAILFTVQTPCMCLVCCSDHIIPYIGSVLLFVSDF